jgi:hypothetical protein
VAVAQLWIVRLLESRVTILEMFCQIY